MSGNAVLWVLLEIMVASLLVFEIVLYRGTTATGQRATGARLPAVSAVMSLVLVM
jgi:hypothetical protein